MVMLALAGCATSHGTGRDDRAISADVRSRISEALGARGSEVEVHVDAGVVTLAGTVATDADRRRAADAATTVDGVKSVINNLQLQ